MRFFVFVLGLALAPSIFAQSPSSTHPRPKDLEKLEEVPSPPNVKNNGVALAAESIAIKEGEEMIEEFRFKGKPHSMRVPTGVGTAYWLVDEKGEGKFSRLDGPGGKANLPMWKLIEW